MLKLQPVDAVVLLEALIGNRNFTHTDIFVNT